MMSNAFRTTLTAIIALLMISFFSFKASAAEIANPECKNPSYSAQEITDAIKNSNLKDSLKGTSCSLGGLGKFESGGRTNIYNGSCCYGVLQMSGSNLKHAGISPALYSCLSLQDQVDYWAALTNNGYETSTVTQLSTMDTFDGQKIDASFIAACIQLGTGNCQQMLDSGKCSGFQDSNGTSICDMADNAKALADKNCKNGSCGTGPGGGDLSPGPNDPNLKILSFA